MGMLNIDRVFDYLVLFSWLVTLYVVGKAFWYSIREVGIRETLTIKRGGWILSRRPLLTILLSVIITMLAMAIVFVQPHKRAVVISALSPDGIRHQPLDAGLNIVVPFLERAVQYPIYNQTFSISRSSFERGQPGVDDTISARSKEGQEILMDASLIFRIDPARLNEVHILWQDRYIENLIRPLVRGYVRGRASQLTVEQIYSSERFPMEKAIFEDMSVVLEENGFIAQEFILRNIAFNPEYATAVEQKVITEQEALRAEIAISTKENQAEQIRTLAQGEADAVVIKAEADAEALRLVNQVLERNPYVLNYEYIKRLSPNIRMMLLSRDNPVLFPLTTGMLGESEVTANPLIPEMPPSGLSADGTPAEPETPPSEPSTDQSAAFDPSLGALPTPTPEGDGDTEQ